jgi:hypothetical protein
MLCSNLELVERNGKVLHAVPVNLFKERRTNDDVPTAWSRGTSWVLINSGIVAPHCDTGVRIPFQEFRCVCAACCL